MTNHVDTLQPPTAFSAASMPMLELVSATCARLGLGHTKIYALIAAGDIEAVTVGRARRIVVASVVGYVERQARRSRRGSAAALISRVAAVLDSTTQFRMAQIAAQVELGSNARQFVDSMPAVAPGTLDLGVRALVRHVEAGFLAVEEIAAAYSDAAGDDDERREAALAVIAKTFRTPDLSTTILNADVVLASEVTPVPVSWLWQRRVAIGKLNLFAGHPGVSKSTLALDITARISTGAPWPDGGGNAPSGSVVILSAEDGIEDTIVPRLVSADANLKRVHVYRGTRNDDGRLTMFSLLRDVDVLDDVIRRLGDVAMVVIDPLSSYLGAAQIDSHSNVDVRGALAPVAALAERRNVAVPGVTHLAKAEGARALLRFMGSLAFIAAARAVYLVTEEIVEGHDMGRKLVLPVKNNLAAPQPGLAYRVAQRFIDLRETIKLSKMAKMPSLKILDALQQSGHLASREGVLR